MTFRLSTCHVVFLLVVVTSFCCIDIFMESHPRVGYQATTRETMIDLYLNLARVSSARVLTQALRSRSWLPGLACHRRPLFIALNYYSPSPLPQQITPYIKFTPIHTDVVVPPGSSRPATRSCCEFDGPHLYNTYSRSYRRT